MLLRRTAVAVALFALVALTAAPAGATVAPPSGTLTCNVTGRFFFTPGLKTAASAGPIVVRTDARSTSCDNSGVTGGTSPITDIKLRGIFVFVPGSSCTNAPIGGGFNHNLRIRYEGRNANNHLTTVASVKTQLTYAPLGLTAWNEDYAPATSGAFVGAPLHLHAAVDYATVSAANCGTAAGLTVLPFTGTFTVG